MSVSRRAFASGLSILPLVGKSASAAHPPDSNATNPPNAAAWHAEFFDDHQLETVATLAEMIIPKTDTPGARDAQVHQHLDHILAQSPESDRTKFLEGLWWLDGYCLQSSARPFNDLPPAQQMEILVHLYQSSEPDIQPGSDFVRLAKTWTAKIYYSTQIGERELNKGGRVPSIYRPDCTA